jgi:multidrug efflux system membrane fusion protein
MNTEKFRSTFRSHLPGAAALALVALALIGLCGHHEPAHAAEEEKAGAKAPPPAVLVTTAVVRQHTVPEYRSGIGTVSAMRSVTVKVRVDGQLDKVGFTEGQDVKAGQMIAQLDPRTLAAQLAQAQATKAKDQATLGNARADLGRYTQLIAEDAATQQQVDTQKALVNQLEATVKTDDAAIAYAQVQLSFTTINAPISGRVGARLVDPGNIVHATDTTGLVVINQIDPIAVVFTLPEEAFQAINAAINSHDAKHRQLVVQAYPRSGDELLGTGSLILLNNQIDTTSGTVQLKGSFPNPQHKLWPGQYVNVRLVLGARDDALTIPSAAVQRSQTGTYVYTVNDADRTVATQPIHVAQMQEGMAIVDQGLKAGQTVVLDGQYKLRPGSTIRVQAPGGKPAAGGAAAPAGARP